MRRVFGCFLFATLLFTAIYLAGWLSQSPRRDLWTPARQGDFILTRTYVLEDEEYHEYPLSTRVNSIVVEFQPRTSDSADIEVARVVASDGWTVYRDIDSHAGEEPMWSELTSVLSRVAAGSSAPDPVQVKIPIAYSPSTRYLDIYFDTPDTAGCRWRLVNLPRPARNLPHNLQPVTTYRHTQFDLSARARVQAVQCRTGSYDQGVLITFDVRRKFKRSSDYDVLVGIKSVELEWLRTSRQNQNESSSETDDYLWQQILNADTKTYAFPVCLPFAGYQRYVRVDGESCIVKYGHGQRVLRLPVRRVRLGKGKQILVAAPEHDLDLEFPGMHVWVYEGPDFPELLEEVEFVPPKDTNRLVFFFCHYSVYEPRGPHSLSISVLPTNTNKRPELHTKEILLRDVMSFAWLLPPGQPVPREIRVYLRTKAEVGRDNRHRFQLVLPVEK